jgi:microcystin-dependent protein
LAAGEAFANNAFTALGAAVTTTPAAGTLETWTVNSTATFPQIGTGGIQQFRLTVGPSTDTSPEIVICTEVVSSTSIQVSRGAEGSPIKTHALGDEITHTFTAGALAALIPAGVIQQYGGVAVPPGWLACDGTAYSRTAYAALFSALALSTTADTNGTTTVTGIPAAVWDQLQDGWYVSGTNIVAPTLISAVGTTSGQITISLPANNTTTGGSIVFAPYGIGDGSTTFNVPDMRSRVPVGVALTSPATGLSARLPGQDWAGGEETHALAAAEGPSHSHTDSGHNHGSTGGESATHAHGITFAYNNVVYYPGSTESAVGGSSWPISGVSGSGAATIAANTVGHTHSVGTGNAAISTTAAASGHNNMQPFLPVYFIIKY